MEVERDVWEEPGASSGSADTSSKKPYCRVQVFRTQKGGGRLRRVATLKLGKDGSGGAQAPSVFVCPRCPVSNPWLGFGGSFTESSALTYNKLSKGRQVDVMNAYFDPKTGLGYTLGRLHIGSCDFSTGTWTCGDIVPDDEGLRGFSIERYNEAMIPMILEAMKAAGGPVRLLASPWSPVPWMRTVKKFNRGTLRPECRQLWAQHYVRFVEAMAGAGVPIWGVSVQNEPESEQPWESCIWSAEEERDFVRDFLGPTLKKAGHEAVKILVWDHNRDGMLERAAVVYSDPEAAKYVWGVAYHWYGDARFEVWPDVSTVPFTIPQRHDEKLLDYRAQSCFDNVRRVVELRPDKHVLFTEGCQELAGLDLSSKLGYWKYGERYAMNIINDINAGCEGWIDWNLCLDLAGGPNHVGNNCVAPIIVDYKNDRVLYQPSFWYLAHFARFIRPGARRVVCGSSRDVLEVTAFVNCGPNGLSESTLDTVAVVVLNQSDQDCDFWLKVSGFGAVRLNATSRSIYTLVIDTEHVAHSNYREHDSVEDASWRKAALREEVQHKKTAEMEDERRKVVAQDDAIKRRAAAKELALPVPEEHSKRDLGRLWLVAGGGGTGGIIVRRGESMQSQPFEVRLMTGAIVEQLNIRKNRLHYQRLSGTGPDTGWITIRHNDRDLVEPYESGDE